MKFECQVYIHKTEHFLTIVKRDKVFRLEEIRQTISGDDD